MPYLENTARNEKIFIEKNSGATYKELAVKYNVSVTRIVHIYEHQFRKKLSLVSSTKNKEETK